MQDDDGAGFGIEPGKGAVEQVALGDPAHAVAIGRVMDLGQLDLDDASLSLAQEVDAGVRHEAVQPVVERRGSRSPGRLRQARIKVSWTASCARSGSRRMRRAVASRRAPDARTSSAKACRSPCRARSTVRPGPRSPLGMRRDHVAALVSLRRWRRPGWFPVPSGPTSGGGERSVRRRPVASRCPFDPHGTVVTAALGVEQAACGSASFGNIRIFDESGAHTQWASRSSAGAGLDDRAGAVGAHDRDAVRRRVAVVPIGDLVPSGDTTGSPSQAAPRGMNSWASVPSAAMTQSWQQPPASPCW